MAIIGIDLGTTNSVVAAMEAGSPTILENSEGTRTTPSVVALSKSGERLAGVLAKRQAVVNPTNTIFSAKRLIGRRFSDDEVQRDKKLLPYEVSEAAGGGVQIAFGDKQVRPAEISAMVLQKLKSDAESKLGQRVTEAVITVPAYFDDAQRKATKDAGKIAGLEVKRIINEPTAAALAYGLDKKKDEKIVVFDLGGGTFDVSILEVSENTIEVRATHGDTHLGGDDFDQQIIDWMLSEFKSQEGIDLSKDTMALQRLKEAAEKAKHELSSATTAEINQPFITTDENGPKHLVLTLSRAKLEELVGELVERSIKVTQEALKEAGIGAKEIDEIVLVGGQTRMPLIQKAVQDFFNKEPHKGINPDEVVAMGAAIQGGILGGEVKDVLLLDVTPLTLGIETEGGVRTPIIDKNTTIPTEKSQVFSTAADNQPQVEIHVLQGERAMATDNKSLGRFILDGIAPAPRGVPQIEVKFDLDASGILNVTASDKGTGKQQSIRIEGSSGLSDEEVAQMQKEAEAHAEEDAAKKELVEVRNQAEQLIYATEKTLKDAGDKVEDEEKKDIEDKVTAVKEVKDKDEKEAIQKAVDELSAAAQKIGEKLYQASAARDDAAAEPKANEGEEASEPVQGTAREAEEGDTK